MRLSLRLIISLFLLCVFSLGSSAYFIDAYYKQHVLKRIEENMRDLLFGLVAVTEIQQTQRLKIPRLLPQARLNQLASGLYAVITDPFGIQIWESTSTLSPDVILPDIKPQAKSFTITKNFNGQAFFIYHFAMEWSADSNTVFHFYIYQSVDDYVEDLQTFRQSLIGWLSSVIILLLGAMLILLKWNLRPLEQAAEEIDSIRHGQRTTLSDDYPQELKTLTGSINELVQANHEQIDKQRSALSNLAHSLKTPTAVLRSSIKEYEEKISDEFAQLANTQIDTIQAVINYHLNKARSMQQKQFIPTIDFSQLVEKTINAFRRIYIERKLSTSHHPSSLSLFPIDEGDAMEILGNTVDNACKWAQSRVDISYHISGDFLSLIIEDDGIGIDQEMKDTLLQRNTRIKQDYPGSGIGLSVVNDLVRAYRGTIEIQRSKLGGAKIIIEIPA